MISHRADICSGIKYISFKAVGELPSICWQFLALDKCKASNKLKVYAVIRIFEKNIVFIAYALYFLSVLI